MGRAATIGRGVRLGGLIASWGVTAAMMVADHLADPFDPSREGTSAYGHNPEGALTVGLAVTLVELALALLALAAPSRDRAEDRGESPLQGPPGPAKRSWAGPAAGLVVSVPWAAFSMLMTMHAGGIVALHFFWVVLLVIVFAISTAWRAVSSEVARAAPREDPRT